MESSSRPRQNAVNGLPPSAVIRSIRSRKSADSVSPVTHLIYCALLLLLAACQRAGEHGSGGLPPTGATATTPPAAIAPASAQSLAAAAPVQLSGVTGLAWLPDGQELALASPVGVAMYSPAGPGLRPQADAAPQLVGQGPNPGLLTAAEDRPVLAWVNDQQAVFAWSGQPGASPQPVANVDSPVTGLDLSPDGQNLAYVTYDGRLVIQPLVELAASQATSAGTPLQAPHWLVDLSYSPDGTQIGGTDLQNFIVYILDARTGQVMRTLEWVDSPLPSLYGAFFSPNWRRIAWVAHSSVQVMDMASGQPGALLGHADAVSALAWSPDGRLLATAAAARVDGGGSPAGKPQPAADLQPAVLVWDPASGDLLTTLAQPQPVQSLSFSPDGARLAVLSSSGALQIWSVSR